MSQISCHRARTARVNRTHLSELEKAASYLGLEIIAKRATVLVHDVKLHRDA